MISDQTSESATPTLNAVTIGIMTALPREYLAVRKILELDHEISIPGEDEIPVLSVGEIENRWGHKHVVAAMVLPEMGNNMAAVSATMFKHSCPGLKCIIMCGIAGAVPNQDKPSEHVRLGDIVVSNIHGVVQYDLDKEEEDGEVTVRSSMNRPASFLMSADRRLQTDFEEDLFPWEENLDNFLSTEGAKWQRPPDSSDKLNEGTGSHPDDPQRRDGRPRVFRGPIAAANKLLKNPKKRNLLRDQYQVKAVEMESSGVSDATWTLSIGYFVVRGTCDYCNSDKGKSWQYFAAAAAAAYTLSLIECVAPFSGPHGASTSPEVVGHKFATGHELSLEDRSISIDDRDDAIKQLEDRIENLELSVGPGFVGEEKDGTSRSSGSIEIARLSDDEAESTTVRQTNGRTTQLVVDTNDVDEQIPTEGISATELAVRLLDQCRSLRAEYEIRKLAEQMQKIEQWLNDNESDIEPEAASELWSDLAISSIAIEKSRAYPDRPKDVGQARTFVGRAKQCLK